MPKEGRRIDGDSGNVYLRTRIKHNDCSTMPGSCRQEAMGNRYEALSRRERSGSVTQVLRK